MREVRRHRFRSTVQGIDSRRLTTVTTRTGRIDLVQVSRKSCMLRRDSTERVVGDKPNQWLKTSFIGAEPHRLANFPWRRAAVRPEQGAPVGCSRLQRAIGRLRRLPWDATPSPMACLSSTSKQEDRSELHTSMKRLTVLATFFASFDLVIG